MKTKFTSPHGHKEKAHNAAVEKHTHKHFGKDAPATKGHVHDK